MNHEIRKRVSEALHFAEHINLYGTFPAIERELCRARYDGALQIVQDVRTRDNKPIGELWTRKGADALRYNERMLVLLEAKLRAISSLAAAYAETVDAGNDTKTQTRETTAWV
jgi:hypothetical protein